MVTGFYGGRLGSDIYCGRCGCQDPGSLTFKRNFESMNKTNARNKQERFRHENRRRQIDREEKRTSERRDREIMEIRRQLWSVRAYRLVSQQYSFHKTQPEQDENMECGRKVKKRGHDRKEDVQGRRRSDVQRPDNEDQSMIARSSHEMESEHSWQHSPDGATAESYGCRRVAIFPAQCRTAYTLRRFIQNEVERLLATETPQTIRRRRVKRILDNYSLPEPVHRNRSTSAIFRDFEAYRRTSAYRTYSRQMNKPKPADVNAESLRKLKERYQQIRNKLNTQLLPPVGQICKEKDAGRAKQDTTGKKLKEERIQNYNNTKCRAKV